MDKLIAVTARAGLLAALLAATGAAQARVNWSVDLNLGYPIAPVVGPGPYLSVLPAGAVSVQVGGGRYWRHGHHWYRPWHGYGGARWVVVSPPVMVPLAQPAMPDAAALPASVARADPVIYPRNGQDTQQTEADRQDCNRWATTQPAALADASVFHRAVEACMDGRGYTMK